MLVASFLTSRSSRDDGGSTVLTFFQFKPEAQAYFQDLARQFEKQNPKIRVIVDNPADPETALRTRLVKNDAPDVMTLKANGTFGEFANAKIFRDFKDDPVLDDVSPAYLSVIGALGRGSRDEVNGVPFAANASGLLYNKNLFARYDVAVPRTFDELTRRRRSSRPRESRPSTGCWPMRGQRSHRLRRCHRSSSPRASFRSGSPTRRRSHRAGDVPPASWPSCTSTPNPIRCPKGTKTAPPRSRTASPPCCCSAATPYRRSVPASRSSP